LGAAFLKTENRSRNWIQWLLALPIQVFAFLTPDCESGKIAKSSWPEESGMALVSAGRKAPAFNLPGIDGRKFSLGEALARGPLLTAFFKISCPTCQFTFPFLDRLYRQFLVAGAAGIQVWGISQDSLEHTQNFAREWGVTFPLLLDEEPYEISQGYGLTYVPSLFLITPGGLVEFSGDGFCKSDLLAIRKSLSQHYSAKPAELFRTSEHIPEFKPG
jgi:peroxiredoxin